MPQTTVDTLPSIALSALGTARIDDVEALVFDLFDSSASSLARYVRGCGLPADVADDIVQEAFVALFRHLQLGRPRDNLRGWLFTVVHRQARKHRRRSARRQAVEVLCEPAILAEQPSFRDDPETAYLARQAEARLRAAFQALPPRQREALLLRAEGLTYRDIASVLAISLGSVAKTLARALAQLSAIDGDETCA